MTKIVCDSGEKPVKLKVAAYCRVSGLRKSQLISLKNQKMHYTKVIAERPDWEFADIYYEAGLSGTHKESRPELQRMLADCRRGRVDLVLTKSLSRFARNTAETLEMVRVLTDLGVVIRFEKEGLETGTGECELLLTILASLAEYESADISENERWALHKRYLTGAFRLSRAPYGYDLKDGRPVVNPEEAKVVKEIFARILEGQGTMTIANSLNSQGVPTKRGGKWHAGTIQHMLENELYVGDLRMQKTWHDDDYHLRLNLGEKDQFLRRDDHEPIISREVFAAASAANHRRGLEKGHLPAGAKNRGHQGPYCFTGRVICAACGSPFKRQAAKRAGETCFFWACRRHLQNAKDCVMGKIWEEDLMNAFVSMLFKLKYARDILLRPYIETVIQADLEINRGRLARDKGRLKQLEGERALLRLSYSRGRVTPVLFRRKLVRIEGEIQRLRRDQSAALSCSTKAQEAEALDRFLMTWEGHCPEEAFVRFTDHVVAGCGRKVTFVMKCGLELDEYMEYRV